MSVVRRRRAKAWRLTRIEILQSNHRPTIPAISALLGALALGRNSARWVGLNLWVAMGGGKFLFLQAEGCGRAGLSRPVLGAILRRTRLKFLHVASTIPPAAANLVQAA